MKRTILSAFLVYIAFVALLYWKQRSMIYFPNTNRPDPAQASWAEVIRVRTSDGLTLEGWWHPPVDDVHPVILFFHGNGDNIEGHHTTAVEYILQGYGILLAEYRGYGGNPGKPSEEGLYKDGRAYIDWLMKEKGYAADRLVIYGESLGSGVATQMAVEYSSKALVLAVPFDSALEMARYRYPFIPFIHLLLKDQYRNNEKIAQINRPCFIGVAEKDTVVPAVFGKKLFAAAQMPKILKEYPGVGHADIYHSDFTQDVMAFLQTL